MVYRDVTGHRSTSGPTRRQQHSKVAANFAPFQLSPTQGYFGQLFCYNPLHCRYSDQQRQATAANISCWQTRYSEQQWPSSITEHIIHADPQFHNQQQAITGKYNPCIPDTQINNDMQSWTTLTHRPGLLPTQAQHAQQKHPLASPTCTTAQRRLMNSLCKKSPPDNEINLSSNNTGASTC